MKKESNAAARARLLNQLDDLMKTRRQLVEVVGAMSARIEELEREIRREFRLASGRIERVK